jgi:glycosyltransferase involved in cell wall biosynthesis
MMDTKVILIIPAYNEEESILRTFQETQDFNDSSEYKLDAIVVNDCSTDMTGKLLDDNRIPHIDLIHNLGIGGAVQTGYKYAYENNYDIAIQFDGDGQHNVNYVPSLIKPLIEESCDLVVGSRFVDKNVSDFKSSAARRAGINLISSLIKATTGTKIYDTTSGFRSANRRTIKKFANKYPTEYPEPVTNEELLKDGYRIQEVAVSMNERRGGVSSIHSWKNFYYMINVIMSILIISMRRSKK